MKLNRDIVKIGDFTFDLSVVTKEGLMKMRNFLPKKEYCRLKNRKCSRLERAKHSLQSRDFTDLEQRNKSLFAEF